MKLSNIRQDSVNTILAIREDGVTVALYNEDDTEITLAQLRIVREGQSTEAAEAAGLSLIERD